MTVSVDLKGGTGDGSGGIGANNGNAAGVIIKGSLIGGSGVDSGQVFCKGDLGVVSITGNVQGGAGNKSGAITSSTGKLAGATVGGFNHRRHRIQERIHL